MSNKDIIPGDQLDQDQWRTWAPGELEIDPPFQGLTPEQVQALSIAAGVEPPPTANGEPPDAVTAGVLPDEPPAQQLGYPTAAELESIHQEAWQTGHDAGFAAGREAGFAEGLAAGREQGLRDMRERFDDAWTPLQQIADAFSASLSSLENELSGDLLAFAVHLAERLVAAHLAADPQAVVPVLREALAGLPATLAQGRLRVNPQDLAVARSFLQQERPETLWQWIEDDAVPRGGCVLETPSLRQDLTLPARMHALSVALGLEGAGDEPA